MDSQARTPKVSIGVPVYNGEKYLEGCLCNLLAQSFADFEIIISDNCSTDKTRSICETIAAADARVRYYRAEANQGATWNFNRVVELASAPYFKWAAYDDLISPDYLTACVRILDAEPTTVIAYGATTIIDGEGNELETHPDRISIQDKSPASRFREYLYKVGLTNAIYGLMRLDTLRRTSGHVAYPGSDMVLLGEFALLGRFHEIPEIIFFRRIHAAASAQSNPSLNQLAAWFNPKHSGRLILPAWEHLRGYSAAIRRTPWGLIEKLSCFAVLLVWSRYGYRNLLREVAQAARHKLARGVPAPQ